MGLALTESARVKCRPVDSPFVPVCLMSLIRALRTLPFQARPPQPRDDALFVATRLGKVPIAVVRSAQARRMTLRVRAAARDVTLTLPSHVSLAGARDFI